MNCNLKRALVLSLALITSTQAFGMFDGLFSHAFRDAHKQEASQKSISKNQSVADSLEREVANPSNICSFLGRAKRLQTTLGNRPALIQAAADRAFEKNRNTNDRTWLYNGNDYYGLVGLDEDLFLKQLAHENTEKQDIYIIDAGCARGKWGKHAMRILQDEECKKSGKHFHIFSVTGGQECDELIKQKGNVTLYQFNQFKIENIDEEFARRGFDLKNKVDLIVSSWTLRHLVDPFGTLKRLYSLLTPQQGKLMSNGFLFKFSNSDDIQTFPLDNENILTSTNNTLLFNDFSVGRDVGQFLLVRNNRNDIEIPLTYKNELQRAGNVQCASNRLTVFDKGNIKPNLGREFIKDTPNKTSLYCETGDQRCQKLYSSLARFMWTGWGNK